LTYYVLGSRILMQGKRGRDVELLRYILNKMAFLPLKSSGTKGEFDSELKQAVIRMQSCFEVEADGVVGRDTYRLFGLEVDEYWPSSLPPLGMRELRERMQGRDVQVLQNRMAASRKKYAVCMMKDEPGAFGKGTQQALRLFQEDCGLKPSGVFDDASCFALYRLTGTGSRVLRCGVKGHDCGYDVFYLQKRLKEKGYFRGEPDGFFSQETEEAVRMFQKDHQLEPDGIVASRFCAFLGR